MSRFARASRVAWFCFYAALFALPAWQTVVEPGFSVVAAIPVVISIFAIRKLAIMATAFVAFDDGRVAFRNAFGSKTISIASFQKAVLKSRPPCAHIVLTTTEGDFFLHEKGYLPYSVDQFLFDAHNRNRNFENMLQPPLWT